jgi:tight adherence protein C
VTNLLIPVVGIVVSLAVLVGMATSYALTRVSPTRRRLAGMSTLAASGVLVDTPSLTGNQEAAVKKLSTFIPKSPKEMGRVQRRLAMAGFHGDRPLVIYVVCELVLAALGVATLVFVFGRSGLLLGAASGFMGYMLPSFFVQFRIAKRKKEIQNGLADALDLLIVCLEAGLGIDQALLKAAEELAIPYPALGEELRLLNVETRAGKPRLEAFRNFARRTQVDDVRSLVAMLIQTDKFGTSVAQALRTFAETSRTKRRQRAEEKAAKLGVKLVFPLVFCLFPAFFVISMGAAVIKLMHIFANTKPFGG